jgi:hypothetical protein
VPDEVRSVEDRARGREQHGKPGEDGGGDPGEDHEG